MKLKEFIEVQTPILQSIYGGASARPFESKLHALKMKVYYTMAPPSRPSPRHPGRGVPAQKPGSVGKKGVRVPLSGIVKLMNNRILHLQYLVFRSNEKPNIL